MTRLLLCTIPALLSALAAFHAAFHALPSNPLRPGMWGIGGLMAFAALGLAAGARWGPPVLMASGVAATAAGFRGLSIAPQDPSALYLLAAAAASVFALSIHREVRRVLFPDVHREQDRRVRPDEGSC